MQYLIVYNQMRKIRHGYNLHFISTILYDNATKTFRGVR